MNTLEAQIEHYRAVRRRIHEAALRCSAPRAAQEGGQRRKPDPVRYVYRYFSPIGPSLPASPSEQRRTGRQIIHEVAAKHGVGVLDICSPCRTARFVKPRQEACYRIYTETTLSMPQVGRLLGGRDHTTVLHGIRAHAAAHGLPVPKRER